MKNGGVSGFAGGAAGYWASNATFLVNNVSSPLLRSAVVSPLAAGAGHVAAGTALGIMNGQNVSDAFSNSFKGIGTSMAVGGALGVASTVATCYVNGVNPLTGKILTTLQSQGDNSTTNLSRSEPKNLSEKSALEEAQHGAGIEIMQGKINDPAWQGWQKIEYIHYSLDRTKSTIHYWRNLVTGETTGFKFE
jgi:hypothetical protein